MNDDIFYFIFCCIHFKIYQFHLKKLLDFKLIKIFSFFCRDDFLFHLYAIHPNHHLEELLIFRKLLQFIYYLYYLIEYLYL